MAQILPTNLHQVDSIVCEAKRIVIVEKEAVFCSLKKLASNNLLLITGKGYPSKSLIAFSARLKSKKFYLLVDWDPYGMDIALNYYTNLRKGSINLLAATSNQVLDNGWLGTRTIELGVSDRKKIDSLYSRLDMSHDPFSLMILQELNFMHNFNAKLELDVMDNDSLIKIISEAMVNI
jgi:DNA topoisomerase VI subunit A